MDSSAAPYDALPMHVYNTVIQQLKQQQSELQTQSQAEQRRLRASESFHQALLASLPCGVLVFGANGLVKLSNPAAKQMLGFASAVGMGAEDIFRGALGRRAGVQNSDEGEVLGVSDEVLAVLKSGGEGRKLEAEYETPEGKKKSVSITISLVPASADSGPGAACVIEECPDNAARTGDAAMEQAASR
jgi:nitrogen fixation/metabolism regulation signal transduction histidine kinase